jgi:hypothetical protein
MHLYIEATKDKNYFKVYGHDHQSIGFIEFRNEKEGDLFLSADSLIAYYIQYFDLK